MEEVVIAKVTAFYQSYPLKSFSKGSTLILSHETPQHLFHLEKGFVRMYLITGMGHEFSLHLFKKGSCFPLLTLLPGHDNNYHYEAFTNVSTRIIPIEDFNKFLSSEVKIGLDLIHRLLHALDGMILRLGSTCHSSAFDRSLATLLYFSKHFGNRKKDKLTFSREFTHEELASFAGLSRETFSREPGRMQRIGLISISYRKLVINDWNYLEKLLQGNVFLERFLQQQDPTPAEELNFSLN